MKKLALSLIPLLMASTAIAEPATDAGVARLTAAFQTYLGGTEGLVTVVANGDVYDLTFDATPLIAKGKDAGVTGSFSSMEFTLEDNGDGTWNVSREQPLALTVSVPNAMDIKVEVASETFEGVFDENLMTFSSLKDEINGMKISETITDPSGLVTTADISMDNATLNGTAAAGANGGVDSTLTMTATGLTEALSTPAGKGQPSVPVTIKAESLTEDFKGSGLALDGIYKLAAWFTAHPSPEAIEADKAGLKAALTAAMPFFGNMAGSGKVSKLSVDTPIGVVGLDEVAFTVDMNGAVADGKFREGISLSGLTLPAGLVPDWAAPILPKKLSLDVQVTDFDAAAGITAAMGAFDLPAGMADTTELTQKVQHAFLPKGNVTITLNPGSVAGDGYELTYEGAMTAGPEAPVPTGKAKVTLAGADKLQAALSAAPDDMKAQAMMGFGMAQGMAKTEGDKLVWEIDASTPGAVSVNGTPLMGGN